MSELPKSSAGFGRDSKNARRKIRVGVLAGGASAERQISIATGAQIAQHLPKDRYEVVLLDPLALMAGNPKLSDAQRAQARALLEKGASVEALPERDRELPKDFQAQIERASAALVPATSAFAASGGDARIDVAFIALHGPWGEDGTIQGVLDLLGIPYVGSGVLASALAMDKVMAKTVLAANGIEVPRSEVVSARELERDPEAVRRAAEAVGYPVVVKPVRQGSSFGTHIVAAEAGLTDAVKDALGYDDRVLVEERLVGTELTCGVIRGDDLVALPVIEIVPKREFFDYRAKYDPALSEEICPARVPTEVAARAQQISVRAHRALGCRGLSRTDLIWVKQDDRMPVLELNTIPGMTANSLLPKAARVAGIEFGDLLERLVRWALEDQEAERSPARADTGEPAATKQAGPY